MPKITSLLSATVAQLLTLEEREGVEVGRLVRNGSGSRVEISMTKDAAEKMVDDLRNIVTGESSADVKITRDLRRSLTTSIENIVGELAVEACAIDSLEVAKQTADDMLADLAATPANVASSSITLTNKSVGCSVLPDASTCEAINMQAAKSQRSTTIETQSEETPAKSDHIVRVFFRYATQPKYVSVGRNHSGETLTTDLGHAKLFTKSDAEVVAAGFSGGEALPFDSCNEQTANASEGVELSQDQRDRLALLKSMSDASMKRYADALAADPTARNLAALKAIATRQRRTYEEMASILKVQAA